MHFKRWYIIFFTIIIVLFTLNTAGAETQGKIVADPMAEAISKEELYKNIISMKEERATDLYNIMMWVIAFFGLLFTIVVAGGTYYAAQLKKHQDKINLVLDSKQFDDKLKEIESTIDKLKEVTKSLIVPTLANLTYGGRWGGMNDKDKHKFRDELLAVADSLNIEDPEVTNAVELFNRYHCWDRYQAFMGGIDKDRAGISMSLRSFIDYKHSNFPTEEQINTILGDANVELSYETKELMKDYLYYVEHKKLRREIDEEE